MVTIRNYQMYSACIATAGLYNNTKNTKHELVTFRNCPGLCPAILPKIIWSCQTANRGSKKCIMQYDGCLPLCKKIASDSKQKENGQYVQKSSGNCLFTVCILPVKILCFQLTHWTLFSKRALNPNLCWFVGKLEIFKPVQTDMCLPRMSCCGCCVSLAS